MTTALNYFCSNSPVTRCVSKVLRRFNALIDIPLGRTNLQMSGIVTGSQFSNDTCKYGQQLTLL